MRLICPRCGAQYEVAADAIPATGRDVQCSNCGHTWFEGGSGAGAARDPSPDPPGGRDVPVVDDEEADDLADLEADPDWSPDRDPDADRPAGPPPDPATAPPTGSRSSVSPEVAGILREEAEREALAREAEAQAAATAAAVALAAPEPRPPTTPTADPDGEAAANPAARDRRRAEEARRRVARLRGEPVPATGGALPPGPPPGPPARRDRLPDIEEINSTLRSTAERGAPSASPAPPRRSGFGTGFWGVLLLAALLALTYAFADPIRAAIPATAAVLTPYERAVDRGRLWLDLRLRDVLRAVGGEAEAAAPVPVTEAPPAVLAVDPAAPASPGAD